jgi:hypothetical protein
MVVKNILTKSFSCLLIIGAFSSCKKEKSALPPLPDYVDTLNTYSRSVKPILDSHCALGGCHTSMDMAGYIILDTYNDAVDAGKNERKFFCVMDWSCQPHMPLGSPKLDDSLITAIHAWKANSFKQ